MVRLELAVTLGDAVFLNGTTSVERDRETLNIAPPQLNEPNFVEMLCPVDFPNRQAWCTFNLRI